MFINLDDPRSMLMYTLQPHNFNLIVPDHMHAVVPLMHLSMASPTDGEIVGI